MKNVYFINVGRHFTEQNKQNHTPHHVIHISNITRCTLVAIEQFLYDNSLPSNWASSCTLFINITHTIYHIIISSNYKYIATKCCCRWCNNSCMVTCIVVWMHELKNIQGGHILCKVLASDTQCAGTLL